MGTPKWDHRLISGNDVSIFSDGIIEVGVSEIVGCLHYNWDQLGTPERTVAMASGYCRPRGALPCWTFGTSFTTSFIRRRRFINITGALDHPTVLVFVVQ